MFCHYFISLFHTLSISQKVSNGLSYCPPLVRKDYFRALLCQCFWKMTVKVSSWMGGIVSGLLKPTTVANVSICSTFTCFHPYMSMFCILTSQSGKTTMFLAICYVALFLWTPEGVSDSGILWELVDPHSNCVCKCFCCKVIVKSLAQNDRKHESAEHTHMQINTLAFL